ncbi:TonB-dependent receptor [Salinimicrobium marinum]|uniref:TonB-dependent receptor n=1 Tax=Salinimicrobium marinum TaxID=680283 RepID=UPI001671CB1E
MHHFLLLCSLLYGNSIYSQTTGIKGVILDENKNPVSSATVQVAGSVGTETDETGFYQLELPDNRKLTISISHLSFTNLEFYITLEKGQWVEINPVLTSEIEDLSEVVISPEELEKPFGVTVLSPETIRSLPGANAGVENLLKTLPGVSSNNELSTQYAVRGGNYDENLVYVNEIEIYRPFLVRSGQQEGWSFVNSDLVRNVHFSAGGFQAKYGDKLSSVLDITYKRPVDFGATLDASLLGVNASIENASEDQKFSAIAGIRFRDNSLFINSRQIETNFRPIFADAQTYLTYQFSEKFEVSFLGNLSLNKYSYEPLTRQTNFGTLQDPRALIVYYNGREEDLYQTALGAVKASWAVNESYTAKFIASTYHTREQEYFDIVAQYRLGEVNAEIGGEDFGKVEFSEGVGSQLTHARNNLDALIVNLEHKGNLLLGEHQIEYGIKFTHEDIRDRLREYEMIDSAGFSLRPPLPDLQNNEPYQPFDAPLASYNSVRAQNETQINRVSGFLQWSKRATLGNHEAWMNIGVRNHLWTLNGDGISSENQSIIIPRAQFAMKPDWKKDMLFRLSGGLYYQPPFYRELRDFSGKVNPDVKAQQALHLVLGNEYSFRLWERPFKLITEAYYKDLNNVNTYTLENVRIRYSATNEAEAYAYGLDLRMNGDFVPGTESWLSFGYLKTEENSNNRGYISRPTDQRLKFGILFQDYVPTIPDLKMYLNLVYNTGLPGGSPNYSDPYLYQSRLPDYKRADLGISYLLKNDLPNQKNFTWLQAFEEFSIGFEIFNLFDSQNSITNTFVRDIYSKNQYAIPNYLTPRVFNVRIGMRL